jgi:hypothetical protein
MLIPFGVFSAGVSSGGGDVGSFALLETAILSTTATSVTFDTSTYAALGYKHLQIRAVARSSGTGAPSAYVRFNSDTATNYSSHYLYGDGGNVSSGAETSSTGAFFVTIASSTHTANAFGAGVMDILDAFASTKYKTTRSLEGQGAVGGTNYVGLGSGNWRNTAAITSVNVYLPTGSFVAGSRFSIYGVK